MCQLSLEALKIRLAALLFLGVLWPGCTSSKTNEANQDRRAKVPVVVAVGGSAHRWTVPSSEERNPTPSEDFLFFLWVKLSRTPTDSVRAIAAMKFDETSPDRQGFAIALSRSGGGIRPEVYWKDASARGGWYPFPEVGVSPHRWTLLALSYRSGKFLGLHSLVRDDEGGQKVSELGGHLVSAPPPQSTKPIIIGSATSTSSFRGKIGPVGIISGRGLAEHISDILAAIDRNPGLAPPVPDGLRLNMFISRREHERSTDPEKTGHGANQGVPLFSPIPTHAR
jgi:hypothetical protein